MGFRRTLFLCHIVLINLVSLTVAQPNFLSNKCNHNDSTSAYKTNRDTLLSTLANKTDQYGFYTSSTGENPDTVYALVLCRPDAKFCRECINNSTTKLKELCPDGKEAIGWYDDCMLRYTNKSVKGIMELKPSYPVWDDKRNVTSVEQFMGVLEKLLKSLGDEAASGGPFSRLHRDTRWARTLRPSMHLRSARRIYPKGIAANAFRGLSISRISRNAVLGRPAEGLLDRVVIFDLSFILSLVKFQKFQHQQLKFQQKKNNAGVADTSPVKPLVRMLRSNSGNWGFLEREMISRSEGDEPDLVGCLCLVSHNRNSPPFFKAWMLPDDTKSFWGFLAVEILPIGYCTLLFSSSFLMSSIAVTTRMRDSDHAQFESIPQIRSLL